MPNASLSNRTPGDTPGGPIRVLVVDDEEHNRLHVQDRLRATPDIEVVGTAADGVEAVEAIRALAPDLVFLDVQMPGMSGLEVVAAVGAEAMPATIFATAFDRYAVAAFDAAAVDYLVKPYDDDRFARALDRARAVLATRATARLHTHLLALLHQGTLPTGVPAATAGPSGGGASPGGYLERVAVESGGRVRPIPVGEIEYITADGMYAELHVGGRQYVIRESMQALEVRLDPARFMRVHRSAIMRLDLVEHLRRLLGGDGELELRDGTRLRVSRTRREALERWLGVPP